MTWVVRLAKIGADGEEHWGDVAQIARWSPKIGRQVTVVPIEDGLHDVFLSAEPVRQRALAAVDSWIEEHAGVNQP